jgi:hypothetical protein
MHVGAERFFRFHQTNVNYLNKNDLRVEKLLCIVLVKPRLTPRTTNHARTSKMTVSGLVIQITIV